MPTVWAYFAHDMGISTSTLVLPRTLEASLARSLRLFPVVVVTGARRTGKSTLVRANAPPDSRQYITLDGAEARAMARNEPRAFVSQAEYLTIDEVQREPDLLITLKEAADRDERPGRFVLTGSANLLLTNRVSESLAGRARYLTLWPMTRREQLGFGSAGCWSALLDVPAHDWLDVLDAQVAPAEDWRLLAARGGYPQPALRYPEARHAADRAELFAGYTQTYLERDLRDLAAIDSLYDFQRLMRAVCERLGNVVHQSDLARDVGLPRTTVQRYLNLLEVSYQLVRVEAYAVNRTKRLMKSPKYYWSDTGLALSLAGDAAPRGAHLENLILTDLLAWRETDVARPAVMYWRTSGGEEVDFVVERKQRVLAVEVKATSNPGYADARHLRSFLIEYADTAVGGLLLHDGTETFWLSDRVLAAPWWKVV
ncbi:MAG: ATPase [Gemmatimonadetes bacterium]|nr:ATPase [Gemmatimonadota bacterium]